MAKRRVRTVSGLAGGSGAQRLRRQRDMRRKRVHWSGKATAASTKKTFFTGSIVTAVERGFGRAVQTVLGKGKRVGRKQYRYKG